MAKPKPGGGMARFGPFSFGNCLVLLADLLGQLAPGLGHHEIGLARRFIGRPGPLFGVLGKLPIALRALCCRQFGKLSHWMGLAPRINGPQRPRRRLVPEEMASSEDDSAG